MVQVSSLLRYVTFLYGRVKVFLSFQGVLEYNIEKLRVKVIQGIKTFQKLSFAGVRKTI